MTSTEEYMRKHWESLIKRVPGHLKSQANSILDTEKTSIEIRHIHALKKLIPKYVMEPEI